MENLKTIWIVVTIVMLVSITGVHYLLRDKIKKWINDYRKDYQVEYGYYVASKKLMDETPKARPTIWHMRRTANRYMLGKHLDKYDNERPSRASKKS